MDNELILDMIATNWLKGKIAAFGTTLKQVPNTASESHFTTPSCKPIGIS
jgi:hypothetical protein